MSVYFKVYEIVQRIPKGRVLTYGAISKLLAGRLSAQGVGWALKALPSKEAANENTSKTSRRSNTTGASKAKAKSGTLGASKAARTEKNDCPYHSGNVPWHRVINSKGGISTLQIGTIPLGMQQSMLESEGIKFDENDLVIDFHKRFWHEGCDAN